MKTVAIACVGIAAATTGNTLDASAAVAYGDKCCDGTCSGCRCGSGEGSGCSGGCECAEFVAHALCAGNYFKDPWGGKCNPGTSAYANWKGYNLRLVSELKKALKEKKGWHSTSTAQAGDVVIYGNEQHACLARGQYHVDCHNNNHCSASLTGIAGGFSGKYVILTRGSGESFEVEPESEEIVLYANETIAHDLSVDAKVDSSAHPASYIAKKWTAVGGPNHHCPHAVSIALAESGGDCKAKGYNSDSVDRGLWQINSKWHSEVSDSCAYDCACNAEKAYKISSKGTDWTPWSTFNNGAYKNHMDAAKAGCNSVFAEMGEEVAV